MLGYIWTVFWFLFSNISYIVGLLSMFTYLLITAYTHICNLMPVNMKDKYKADWALVTGSSSGIGASIAEKLAQQKINVIMVALDDKMLTDKVEELRGKYSDITFRRCGCNLGGDQSSYMPAIIEASRDVDVKIVFNNAGYIQTGFFADVEVERIRSNLNCNAVAAVEITHHFIRKLIASKSTGFIGFTSSAGQYLPGPTCTLYSSTKAFLTNFASTTAAEVHDVGIDVTVCHPSPVNTNFYAGTAGMTSLETAKKAAVGPEVIADTFFAAAGRLLVYDQGLMCAAFRMANKVFDFAFFQELVKRTGYIFNKDHQTLADKSKLRAGKAA